MNDDLRAKEFWAAINSNSIDFCASTWNIPENPLIPKALVTHSAHIKVSTKVPLDDLAQAQRVVCRNGSIVQLPQCNCDNVTVRLLRNLCILSPLIPVASLAASSHLIAIPLRHHQAILG